MTRTTLVLVGLLSAGAATQGHAQRSHIGPHVGYNFDFARALVGGHMLIPLGGAAEFYPSFDYYLVDRGSRFGLSGDLKLRLPTGGGSAFYLGGGLDFQRAGVNGVSNSDTGWDALFGLESRHGVAHPYVEGRLLGHDNTTFQVSAGLNLTL